METEMLTIFDKAGLSIGTATRAEVHEKGHWHQTFQCYVIGLENNEECMYIQLRSHLKKDFANLYDMTAAGHILYNESISDGIREVWEELGLNVSYNQLTNLGIIPNVIETENIIDHELSHVFLYEMSEPMDSFVLQLEEVSGMAKAPLNQFIAFFSGQLKQLDIEGFKIDLNGNKNWYTETIDKEKFVPHSEEYLKNVAKAISLQRTLK